MEPFKNWLNSKVAEQIAEAIKRNWPSFNQKAFLKNIDQELRPLELKARVHFLSEKLHTFLPSKRDETIALLLGALKINEQDQVGLSGIALWPLTHYISLYGLDYFDLSMEALKEMTKLSTGEFAVRPFFINDQKRVLKIMKEWSRDDNEHVRRWVSEGLRPLLPWGMKLQAVAQDPNLTWGILEQLKNDPSEYVRKSVANHINDHSKNHPEYVIEKLLAWHTDKNKTPEIDWVIKHASRSLIKKGYPRAFLLHGAKGNVIKVLQQKIISKKVKLGESLRVKVTLENVTKKEGVIILDHEVHLLRGNGRHNIKVFKGKKMKLAAGEMQSLELAIPLKVVTTRVYYPGKHYWNVLVNGISEKKMAFTLES